MSTFISRFDQGGRGLRLAVKDAIDVAGVPTTAGSRAVARRSVAAATDAACLAAARQAGVRLVGKTNLHELCFGRTGVNPWFGTPINPVDGDRVPGGSSSGSAVAVATGEADIALGTDTAGSIRNPAACCAVVGLKTTWGRVPLEGVWPLSPFMDTVGPMARTVDLVEAGMALLEPGFTRASEPPTLIGRVRGLDSEPRIDRAVDAALASAGFEVVDVDVPRWRAAHEAALTVLFAEALVVNRQLVDDHLDELGADLVERFGTTAAMPPDALEAARSMRPGWRDELAEHLDRFDLLALPTLTHEPPALDAAGTMPSNVAATPVNLAGHPALSLPVRSADGLGPPASLQLVGPDGSEDRLLAAGAEVERITGPYWNTF